MFTIGRFEIIMLIAQGSVLRVLGLSIYSPRALAVYNP